MKKTVLINDAQYSRLQGYHGRSGQTKAAHKLVNLGFVWEQSMAAPQDASGMVAGLNF